MLVCVCVQTVRNDKILTRQKNVSYDKNSVTKHLHTQTHTHTADTAQAITAHNELAFDVSAPHARNLPALTIRIDVS